MNIIGISDYLLLPVYFFILLAFVLSRSKKYEGSPLKKYFIAAFMLHFAGSVLNSMMLQYYYTYGDGFTYFQGGEFIKQSVFHGGSFLKVFFMSGEQVYNLPGSEDVSIYAHQSMLAPSSLSAIKFSGFFSIFSFSHFLINAVFCGFLSFIGIWKLFTIFNKISKGKFQKPLAIALIWTPTIWYWGSGLGKDAVSFGLLGILTAALYNFFTTKRKLLNFIVFLICIYLLSDLKSVLAGITVISFLGYLFIALFKKIKSKAAKFISALLSLAAIILLFSFVVDRIQSELDDAKTMVETNIIAYAQESEESKGGFKPMEFDLTPAGIITAIPQTVFSTLYRPYIWEAGKVVILFSALESLLMLIAMLYVFFRKGPFVFFASILKNPAIMYCFIFCTLMAMAVGFTTFNFGTMVRYRLPLLPFYIFMILEINSYIIAQSQAQVPVIKGIIND